MRESEVETAHKNPIPMAQLDARVAYAVGAFAVDCTLGGREVREACTRLWLQGEEALRRFELETEYSTDFTFPKEDLDRPLSTKLREWEDRDLQVLFAGLAQLLYLGDTWCTEDAVRVFTVYVKATEQHLNERKLRRVHSVYQLEDLM
jgi:hypothetical protein